MQHEIFRRSEKRWQYLLIVYAVLALCLSPAALAQSGRRQSKSAPSPPPVVTEPKIEPASNPPTTKPKPAASLIVGGDKYGSSIYTLSGYVDEAIQDCTDRLREFKVFEVTGGGNMTRKDAIDRAKKEQDAYVLWLELKVEDDANSNTVLINFFVFTPQTAKIMTSGRVYLGAKGFGKGGVVVGVPSATRRLPLQYQVKEGAQEVADRVRGKFRAGLPD